MMNQNIWDYINITEDIKWSLIERKVLGTGHGQGTPYDAYCVLVCLAPPVLALTYAEDEYHPELNVNILRKLPARFNDERTSEFWYKEAHEAIKKRLQYVKPEEPGRWARNVILFLGDGMSVPTLAAARALLGQRRNETGEEAQLSFESFPAVGLAKTYCVNAQIADSACTATAYLCGVKNNYGTLGVTAAVPRHDCSAAQDPDTHLTSIASWMLESGRDIGIVTSTRVTHASPAGAYARSANRGWENDADVTAANVDIAKCPDIAHQLVHHEPGKRFKVILGGGRQEFRPTTEIDEEGTAGLRTDGRDLIREWRAEREAENVTHEYVWNRKQLLSANESLPEYLLGLFEGTHIPYHLVGDPEMEPTLAELTEVAIRMLSRNDKGYFLFVEGGRIDHAHHANRVELALDETIEFSEAVARATELVTEDTLVAVTADHAHVMAFNGYSVRGNDILGPSGSVDTDGVPYMTISYTNGPGQRDQVNGQRVDVTRDTNYRALAWRSHADAPRGSETHGADDAPVFALGPHAALFGGLYEQTQIPHVLAYAACVGSGPTACSAAPLHTMPIWLLGFVIAILSL